MAETPKFVVYSHSIGGEVIYIGMGKPTRPYSTQRNSKWKALTAGVSVHIAILGEFRWRSDAADMEFMEIKRLKPICNLRERAKVCGVITPFRITPQEQKMLSMYRSGKYIQRQILVECGCRPQAGSALISQAAEKERLINLQQRYDKRRGDNQVTPNVARGNAVRLIG